MFLTELEAAGINDIIAEYQTQAGRLAGNHPVSLLVNLFLEKGETPKGFRPFHLPGVFYVKSIENGNCSVHF